MEELKPCPFCNGEVTLKIAAHGFDILQGNVLCKKCGASVPFMIDKNTKDPYHEWNTRYEHTCTYEPDMYYSYYDEDDNEHLTKLADDDGFAYECSVCGFAMLREGWFMEEPGEHGGWEIEKRLFDYCPGCGAKVMD